MKTIISKNIEETKEIASKILKLLQEKKRGRALVVGLYGDLGSGKTTFVKQIADILGVENTVVSPTFVIEKIYKIQNNKFNFLVHIDAYRLEKAEELKSLGWEVVIKDEKNLIFIEWPEKLSDILLDDVFKIYFKFIDDNSREIKW